MALTIRLTEEEINELQEIQKKLNQKTASGTIKKMISLFMENQNSLEKYIRKKKYWETRTKLNEETLNQIKRTFKMLVK